MSIAINDRVRPSGHFTMQETNDAGETCGPVITVRTIAGILLNSHRSIDKSHAERIAEMARLTPDYPFDLCVFVGSSGHRQIVWSARVIWRNQCIN